MFTHHWQKSTYSGEASNCVETATTPTTIRIRDSKRTNGPHLTVASSTWTTFISYAASPRRTP